MLTKLIEGEKRDVEIQERSDNDDDKGFGDANF